MHFHVFRSRYVFPRKLGTSEIVISFLVFTKVWKQPNECAWNCTGSYLFVASDKLKKFFTAEFSFKPHESHGKWRRPFPQLRATRLSWKVEKLIDYKKVLIVSVIISLPTKVDNRIKCFEAELVSKQLYINSWQLEVIDDWVKSLLFHHEIFTLLSSLTWNISCKSTLSCGSSCQAKESNCQTRKSKLFNFVAFGTFHLLNSQLLLTDLDIGFKVVYVGDWNLGPTFNYLYNLEIVQTSGTP